MCIQKTEYSCKHALLRQLPCGHEKEVKQRRRSCFSLQSPTTKVPCHRRYDWILNEPCPKCRKVLEEARSAQEPGSRGYPPPTLQSPTSRGQRVERRFHTAPARHAGARAARPDSYLDPGLNAELSNLSGHYELPSAMLSARGPRRDSYHDPGLNAQLSGLPSHYELPRSARLAMPSPHLAQGLAPARTPTQGSRPPLPLRRRGHIAMPLQAPSEDSGHFAPENTDVSPVSIGDADQRPVSPLSITADVRFQSWQHSRSRY